MDLYGQEPELSLLAALLPKLDRASVIDVGAEQGALADGLLRAGARELYALEAHPENVAALASRFATDPRVTVHEAAISDADGSAELHVSVSADGSPVTFGHTLLSPRDTDEVAWGSTLTVERRSLGSLVADGVLPARVGILKVDTEGHDLAVIAGMGTLACDIVMVEHWTDLPHGLGPCPWRLEEMLAQLEPRGFSHFAFLVHQGEFVTLRWDDGYAETGVMGNLVFVHDRVLQRSSFELLACATRLADDAVAVGRMYMTAAGERLEALLEARQAAEERLVKLQALNAELRVLKADPP